MSAGTTEVTLPDGCFGLQMRSDGTEFNGKPGGKVRIPDEYMPELKESNAVRNGLISASTQFSIGTKRGRACPSCNFRAQAWSIRCPRCGTETREENLQWLFTQGLISLR